MRQRSSACAASTTARLGDAARTARRRAVPAYAMPEDAVRALAAATRYGAVAGARTTARRSPPPGIEPPHRRGRRAHGALGRPAGAAGSPHDEASALLQAYGIDVWGNERSLSADEAVGRRRAGGLPRGAEVDRADAAPPGRRRRRARSTCAREAACASRVRSRSPSGSRRSPPTASSCRGWPTPGVPCVITSDEDPLFGPVVGFSVAGPPTELLGDIGYRIPPLTDVDVSDLISSVQGGAGAARPPRRRPGAPRPPSPTSSPGVSVLADDLPEVASLVLNPVNAHPGGVDVLGAEVVLAPAPRRADPGRRSLT